MYPAHAGRPRAALTPRAPAPAPWTHLVVATALCLTLSSSAACARTQAGREGTVASAASAAAPEASRCPPGTFDYGDGMVACALPPETTTALRQARAAALQAAGPRLSDFLAEQPWRPHVSVIYGVTEDRATPAQRALAAFVAGRHGARACFGGLHYWDDAHGNKTTLVVDVDEPAGQLTTLHDALASAAQIGSRYAYHPHVTLAYLQLGVRLQATEEAAVLAPLAKACWQGSAFYLTDPCGQTLSTQRMD